MLYILFPSTDKPEPNFVKVSYWFSQTDLMFDVHLFEDCGTVVGDSDVAVRRHHHLVQPFRAQRRPKGVGHSPGGHDVALKKTQMSNMCALFCSFLLRASP